MKKYRKLVSLLLALALVITLGSDYIPGKTVNRASAEESSFENLNQKEIVEAMGAGWNLGNQLEASTNGTPKEDEWTGVMITERMIRTAKTSGFKSIRIPVSYLSMIGSAPNYKINEEWLDRVQQIVDWAIKYKLYVIINIHGDGYSTVKGGWLLPDAEDQDTIKTKYEKVWQQIADRFKDYDHHLIYESMNEVGADITKEEEIRAAYENINAYNQIFVDTVRKSGGNNDKRWLLIPGLNTNVGYTAGDDSIDDYGFKIPEDSNRSAEIPESEKRIMISVHYYTPWEFCGQDNYNQTQWGSEADPAKSVGYGGEDEMEKQFARLKAKFTDQGYPVVIGEYGAVDKSTKKDSGVGKSGDADPANTEFRAYFAWKLCSLSVQNGCIPVYWDNGWNGDFGFGLFDRTTYKITQPDIINAIMKCFGMEKGVATDITLDKTVIKMDLSDSSQQLTASLTPADAGDTITWSSSDAGVASVSYKGKVTPKGIGTCVITATVPNGASAYCIVQVTSPKSLKAGLYFGNSSDWQTISCEDYLTLSENGGGTYTISVSGTKAQLLAINTLFLKDVTVERKVSEETNVKSATFTVNELKFNDTPLSMSQNVFYFDKSVTKTLDICMINCWAEEVTFVEGLTKGNQCYSFPADSYVDGTNTLTMKVTVSDAVLDLADQTPEIPATALTLSKESLSVGAGKTAALTAVAAPENTTEKVLWFSENPKIATVSQDGTVTGVVNGETIIHALTISGMDTVCKVTVSDDPGTTDDPTPPTQDPNTPSDPTPDPKDPSDPSVDPGKKPGANSGNTAKPKSPTKKVTKVKIKRASVKKVKSTKKKTIQVTWKKIKGVSGYQVRVSLNKKATKGKRIVNVKGAKKTKKIIKKLKSKKKYFVRVRAYKTTKGTKRFGSWSKIKKVKVK